MDHNDNVPFINDFFVAYSKVYIECGTINLCSELAVNELKITGYVKPMAQNTKVVNWEMDKETPLNLVWQAIRCSRIFLKIRKRINLALRFLAGKSRKY